MIPDKVKMEHLKRSYKEGYVALQTAKDEISKVAESDRSDIVYNKYYATVDGTKKKLYRMFRSNDITSRAYQDVLKDINENF